MESDEVLHSTVPIVAVACRFSCVVEFCVLAGSVSIRRNRQSTRWRKTNKSDVQPMIMHGGEAFAGALTKSVQATGTQVRLPSGSTSRKCGRSLRRTLAKTSSTLPSSAWCGRITRTRDGRSRRWVVCRRLPENAGRGLPENRLAGSRVWSEAQSLPSGAGNAQRQPSERHGLAAKHLHHPP